MKTHTSILAAATLACFALSSDLSIAQTVVKETTTTNTMGTVSEFSPDTIVIRSETSPDPLRYTYSKTTTYVDETGAPVSIETVKSGLPVTVYYTRTGDKMVATRVIVRKAVVPPPVIEKKTTTTTTTTTTDKDRDRD
jgi:hypothetical protein